MPGIYIHIPFCKNKCSYCDFYSIASTTYLEPFLGCLENEMHKEQAFLPDGQLNTIYIGGGTPSVCSPQQIAQLFNRISSYWDLSNVSEITFEANPEDLSLSYLEALKLHTPINRISMGVQSFNDDELKFMCRRHSAQRAIQAYQDARAVGYDNISLDLIYGLPEQTTDQWIYNLDKILELSPEHISAYHLSIEPQTRFGVMATQGQIKPVSEQTSQSHYDILCQRLQSAGYEHYEISNFARKGKKAIHNSSYWNNEPYLGLGPGAHSFDGHTRRWCSQSVVEFIQEISYESEEISQVDSYNEFIMLALRQNIGVDIVLMKQRYGQRKTDNFVKTVQKHISQGVIAEKEGKFYIKPEFWLISDTIMSDLFIL